MTINRKSKHVNLMMEFLNPVVDGIMAKETKRLKNLLNDLLIRNHAAGGSQDAYIHSGQIFALLPRRYLRNTQIKLVCSHLVPEAEIHKASMLKLEQDTRRIRQGLSVVIPKCDSEQDIRDVLPETLVMEIPEFQGMPRQRDEGFLLKKNPLLHGQYHRTMELALYYQVNQLIF